MRDYSFDSPGALAAAAEAAVQSWLDLVEDNTRREAAARHVIAALFDCDPRDRVPLLDFALDKLRGGQPMHAIFGVMEEASYWADWASRDELKAYALASFNRLAPSDQRAFLDHVQGGGRA